MALAGLGVRGFNDPERGAGWNGQASSTGGGVLTNRGRTVDAIPALVLADYTKERPFTNSLGQPYVPVSNVLVGVWETRLQDFRAFAQATGFKTETNMWSWAPGWGLLGHSWESPGFPQTDSHPVVGVSWEDAKQFCVWLTEKERKEGRIGPKDRYRLPTDAEWSAAVGPTQYPWGEAWPPPNRVGNYADKEYQGYGDTRMRIDGYEDGYRWTSPVGSYPANPLGLYDLGGNVWEWCEDQYHRPGMDHKEAARLIPELVVEGYGPSARVLRGGAWLIGRPAILESGSHFSGVLHSRICSNGFRCVLELGGFR
jgi:formylglycine-generating enzyme required for sulfatase activity